MSDVPSVQSAPDDGPSQMDINRGTIKELLRKVKPAISLSLVDRTFDPSSLDSALRSFLFFSRLFTQSWGRSETLKDLLIHKRSCTSQMQLAAFTHEHSGPVQILKEERKEGVRMIDAVFDSPYANRFPAHCPPPINKSVFRVVMPKESNRMCIHLAGTGDHTFWRRDLTLSGPLLKNHGVASMLIANPFYAERKPSGQFRSAIPNVSDLFVMGGCLMSEVIYLLEWARKELGYTEFVVSGVSMGGFMASLASSNIPFPVGCVPILSSSCAGPSYTDGLLKDAIPWDVLEKQLLDRDYVRAIEAIPDCHWIEQAHEDSRRNGKPLSYSMMRILMEEFTSLDKYPCPVAPQSAKAVIADGDKYIIQEGLKSLPQVWEGADHRFVRGGHVSSYIWHNDVFIQTILESFANLK